MFTFALTAVIALAIVVVRHNVGLVASVWSEARMWERAVLVAALLPIPGPMDEILGLIVITRIRRRRR